MTAFLERLVSGPCVVLDGGMGTMLLASGLERGSPPEAWNAERPSRVTEIHRAYVEAGSEAVHTNTFGAHPQRLGRFGLSGRCEELCEAAVRAARASGAPFVLGDIGPTGEDVPPGGIDEGAWREGFYQQASALAGAGVDALHLETWSDVRDARAALEAVRKAAPQLPILVSMTFVRNAKGFCTRMGEAASDSLRLLAEAGADGVGANCLLMSGAMADLVREILPAIPVPLVVQPAAGMPELRPEGAWYSQEPDVFAADLAPLASRGVRALGGCCGTDPRFIQALASRLRPEAS